MYIDQVLFIVGASLLLAASVIAVRLVGSRRRSRNYRRILREETKHLSIMETLRSNAERLQTTATGTASSAKAQSAATEKLVACAQGNVAGEATEALSDDSTAPDDGKTVLLAQLESSGGSLGADLNLSPLVGRYELLREIKGGGMSRIFLAKHIKLGNEWIVKFVDHKNAELANEADVLKKLNHISLPQIIDIFQTKQGTFLVERYIEGYTLAQVLEVGQDIGENQISDWALQLAQVLNYLHTLETPIVHCDLKPSNIMVTYDNRLVLIDFGISKQGFADNEATGITYGYAAPEQFGQGKNSREIISERFGSLPEGYAKWALDARTDIYSAGVILFRMATGTLPTAENQKMIYDVVSSNLADVITKCIQILPEKRYQNAQQLVEALNGVKTHQLAMVRSLALRRVAAICAALLVTMGAASTASATYINRVENVAVITMDPSRAVVTEQQSVQLLIQKSGGFGGPTIDPSKVKWTYSDDSIARIDGDRLIGVNVGETQIIGKYRNKEIELTVNVTEPVHEMTSIALRYVDGARIDHFAGTGERDFSDGSLSDCSFVSPESVCSANGKIYLTDSGTIRVIENGEVTSMPFEPSYVTADLVRSYDGDLYVLTGPWETDDGSFYGIVRMANGTAEFIYYTQAEWSVIPDFAFSQDGTLWFIQQNIGTGMTTLNSMKQGETSAWIMDLPESAAGLVFDKEDNLYISVPESGIILRIQNGSDSWEYFVGVDGEKNFIDGAIPNFYRPTSLAVSDGYLYVLDFDTVRRVVIAENSELFAETVVGVPENDTNPDTVLGKGYEAFLPASETASIAFDGEGRLLLTSPKGSVVYEITLPEQTVEQGA